jgi:hypothetical protein
MTGYPTSSPTAAPSITPGTTESPTPSPTDSAVPTNYPTASPVRSSDFPALYALQATAAWECKYHGHGPAATVESLKVHTH